MPESQAARDAADHVSRVLGDTFVWLDELREHFRSVYDQASCRNRELSSDNLSSLRGPIFRQLEHRSDILAGTGVIVAEDVLSDRRHWLEWWQTGKNSSPSFLVVDHDPTSVDFYDYHSASWFTIPRHSGNWALVGPYVDYFGTEEYMLTLARPVESRSRFLGVAAADIYSGVFETLLLQVVGHAFPAVVLVSSAGRVVASNTASRVAGSLITGSPAETSYSVAPELTHDDNYLCAGLPWSLLVLGPN